MTKPARAAALLLLVALPFFVTSCDSSGASSRARDGSLRIVATIGMIGDVASRIAKQDAHVDAMMGPGVDPHLYKATEGDIRRLTEADLILYNGLNLEGKMGDILVKVGRSRPVVAVSESVPENLLREPPEFAGHYDPHIWFDVSLWAMTIDPIVRELSSLDPDRAAEYRRNGEALKKELLDLDAWVASEIASIPKERRVLVTAHDAFGYFGERYGIEVKGLQGISTVAEAGLADVERLVETVVSRKVPAIFVESSVPRRAIEAVQKACESRGHSVKIGGELFSDAMGAADSPEGTYPGMVRHNVRTIVEALR